MSAFGFDASVLRRLALGGAFCLAACVLVWVVERDGGIEVVPPVLDVDADAARPVLLAIESTYPVSTWTVSVDGVPAVAERADGTSWSGTLRTTPGAELLVIGAGPAGEAVNRCLRLRLGDAEPRLVWGGGDVTTTVELP